jgi:hypothetical protein
MAKDSTVSKPGTSQTITPPADMALNSTVAKDATVAKDSTVMKAASYSAPPSAADIKTAIEADGSKLDHLWEMTEDDGGVRRLTTNALEQAPSGGLDAAGIRTAVGLASANLDTQLADLPTTAEFELRSLPAADYTVVGDLGTLTEAGIDAIFDRNSSLGVSFETLINRLYQINNNKMIVNDASGIIALRNIGDSGNIASGVLVDDLTNTTRDELTWA